MLKFRQVREKSCLNKYKLNKPKNEEQATLTSFPNKTQTNYRSKYCSPSSQPSIRGSYRQSARVQPRKEQIDNQTPNRYTAKKMNRHQTEPKNPSATKDFMKIKEYIRNIATTCNKVDKRMTCQVSVDLTQKREENKRFMLRHLSFSEIEEDKINAQKEYLRRLKEFKGQGSKVMMQTHKIYDMQLKKHEQRYIHSFKTVDKIFEVLQEMEKLGYQIRTNKYLIHFCTDVKIWLACIFLLESKNKKDAFSIKTKWFVHVSPAEAKKKLSQFISRSGNIGLSAIVNDLDELLDHMENALSHKKIIQISKVQNYIESRMIYRKSSQKPQWDDLRLSKYKHQNLDFSQNLTQLEEKYGAMREITKVSRCRFQDLNKTYQRLQTLL